MKVYDPKIIENLSLAQQVRWFKRGSEKMDKLLRIENIAKKLMHIDIYVREMMKLNLGAMNPHQVPHNVRHCD